jgi:hypothetical protein
MHQGRRIAAFLAIAAVTALADAVAAPALDVPVTTTSVSGTGVSVPPPPTVTVPSVPTPVSPPPVSTPSVSTTPPPVTEVPAPSPEAQKTVQKTISQTSTPQLPTSKGRQTTGSDGSGGVGTSSGGIVRTVTGSLSSLSGAGSGSRTPSTGSSGTTAAGGYTAPGDGRTTVSPLLGGTPGAPGGGGFIGPSGFGGPGGFGGGPGSPTAFALGIPAGSIGSGTGGVSALAAAVGSLAGCFYALTPFEQQILIVRTGIDGGPALSRSAVAALLGTSPRSVAAIETTALRELRGAARSDGCMPVAGAAAASALSPFVGGPFGPLGYVAPGMSAVWRANAGGAAAPQPQLATTSFGDRLATLDAGSGQASLSVLMMIVVMLSGGLAALLLEARRSVN